nr:hypothetical protein CFP56_11758 [Quercus suber]
MRPDAVRQNHRHMQERSVKQMLRSPTAGFCLSPGSPVKVLILDRRSSCLEAIKELHSNRSMNLREEYATAFVQTRGSSVSPTESLRSLEPGGHIVAQPQDLGTADHAMISECTIYSNLSAGVDPRNGRCEWLERVWQPCMHPRTPRNPPFITKSKIRQSKESPAEVARIPVVSTLLLVIAALASHDSSASATSVWSCYSVSRTQNPGWRSSRMPLSHLADGAEYQLGRKIRHRDTRTQLLLGIPSEAKTQSRRRRLHVQ